MRSMYWLETPDGGVRPAEMIEAATLSADARRVALDEDGDLRVSTVFLAIDHSFAHRGDSDARPLLYESMVFRGENDDLAQERYHTRAEALAGHAVLCREYLGREPRPVVGQGGTP